MLRVDCGARQFVVKGYRPGPRDRQASEAAAIAFLRGHGIHCVPDFHVADAATGLSLLEFVPGAAAGTPDERDLDQAIAFALALVGLSSEAETDELPHASASVLSLRDLAIQLAGRRQAFAGKAFSETVTTLLLRHEELSAKALARAEREAAAVDWRGPLPRDRWILSASDFGFHNAVRRPDGALCFLDFEYFGWDDPVKMICDFCLHPGHELRPGFAARFREALLARLAETDPAIARRERFCRPLYALCWALIVLNDHHDARLEESRSQALALKSETYLAEAERLLAGAAC